MRNLRNTAEAEIVYSCIACWEQIAGDFIVCVKHSAGVGIQVLSLC